MMLLNSSNKLKILHTIGRRQPICRGELSRLTGLPSPTITNIVSELINNRLVAEAGYQVSTGGRKPALLELVPDTKYLLGVELNAQRLSILLLDLKADVRHKHVESVAPGVSQEDLQTRLLEGIDQCLQEKSDLRGNIAGIGMGISGLVDSSQGVSLRFPGIVPWPQWPLAEILGERFGMPVFVENNVALRTLAELWFGRGRGHENFLFISIGPHIRMGIVINGQLYRGASGNAGELGHMTYQADGPLCYCGNSGCLELFASTTALVQQVREVLHDRSGISGSPLVEIAPERLQAAHVFDAARDGDRLAHSILDKALNPLGLAIASLVNMFDTECIVLGGPMAAQGDLVLERIRQTIDKRSLPHLAKAVKLEATAFGPEGAALGGGALVMQRLFEGAIPLQ